MIPTLAGMTTATTSRRLAAIALTSAGALLLSACSGSNDNEGPEQPCQVASYTADAQEQLDDEGVSAEEVAAVVAETCAGGGDKEWDEEGYWDLEHDGVEVRLQSDGVVTAVAD